MPDKKKATDTSYAQPTLAQPLPLEDMTNTEKDEYMHTTVAKGTSDVNVDTKPTKRKRDDSSILKNRRVVKAKRTNVRKVSRDVKHTSVAKRARFLSPEKSKHGRTSLYLAKLASPNFLLALGNSKTTIGVSSAAIKVRTPPGFGSLKAEQRLPPPGFTPKHFDPSTFRYPTRKLWPRQAKLRPSGKTPGRRSASPPTFSLNSNVTGPFDFGLSLENSGLHPPTLRHCTSTSSPTSPILRTAISSPYRFGSLSE